MEKVAGELKLVEVKFIIDGFFGDHEAHRDITAALETVAPITEFQAQIGFRVSYLRKDGDRGYLEYDQFSFLAGMLAVKAAEFMTDHTVEYDQPREWSRYGATYRYLDFWKSREYQEELEEICSKEELEEERRQMDEAPRELSDDESTKGEEEFALLGA